LVEKNVLLLSIMGRVPKSHSIHVQNPTKSPFSNKDLVWTSGMRHGGQNKMNIQFAYVPYACIPKKLEGEWGDMGTIVEWNVYKKFQAKWMSSNQSSKPPWAYVVNIYGINLFNLLNSYTKEVIIYILSVFWSRYQCGYGPKDYWEDSTYIRSI
jgi:hypothetical protein